MCCVICKTFYTHTALYYETCETQNRKKMIQVQKLVEREKSKTLVASYESLSRKEKLGQVSLCALMQVNELVYNK